MNQVYPKETAHRLFGTIFFRFEQRAAFIIIIIIIIINSTHSPKVEFGVITPRKQVACNVNASEAGQAGD